MFLALLDIRNFREISSERLDDYDIALVEGSITRQDEVERLKAIRAQITALARSSGLSCSSHGAYKQPALRIRQISQPLRLIHDVINGMKATPAT